MYLLNPAWGCESLARPLSNGDCPLELQSQNSTNVPSGRAVVHHRMQIHPTFYFFPVEVEGVGLYVRSSEGRTKIHQNLLVGSTHKVLKPNAKNRATTGNGLSSPFSMARLSLLAFLALAFSNVTFAAPQDLGAVSDLRARDGNEPYFSCGACIRVYRGPTRGI